jgi:phage gpG-like protein
MSGWDAGLQRFTVKMGSLAKNLLPAVAATAHASIVDGSPLTGSPGQPVDTGNLKSSWVLGFPAPDVAEITTNVVYAPHNEYGVTENGRPYTQRSPVGGRYSVALTRTAMQRIVDHEAQKLMGGAT